jgi:uncharacterized protein
MKTIGITGGTGFIGDHLSAMLVQQGYGVVVFTRKARFMPKARGITYAQWDADKAQCDTGAVASLHAMIHLAGAGIADKRWTKKRKDEILESRVRGTSFIVSQLKEHAKQCNVFIAASATGYYGPDRGNEVPFTEADPACDDFLGNVCKQWEMRSSEAAAFARTVILRFGIVLGGGGGAFGQFAKPLAWRVMPLLGSGKQQISWIEIDDLTGIMLYALGYTHVAGIFNAVAPEVVSQAQLMKTIAKVKNKYCLPVHVPAALLKMALGEVSGELLKSCTASSKKIADAGFVFRYPGIDDAVRAIVGAGS